MSEELVLEFGAAAMVGVFLLQVIDRILKVRANGKRTEREASERLAGERSVDFWIQATYKSVRQAVQDEVGHALTTIQADTERLRVSAHRANEIGQTMSGKLDAIEYKVEALIRQGGPS